MKAKKGTTKRGKAGAAQPGTTYKSRTRTLTLRDASNIIGGETAAVTKPVAKLNLSFAPEYTRHVSSSGSKPK